MVRFSDANSQTKKGVHSMKKRTLLRSIVLLAVVLLLAVGGNTGAINQFVVHFPIIYRNLSCSDFFFDSFSDPNSGWFTGETDVARYKYH